MPVSRSHAAVLLGVVGGLILPAFGQSTPPGAENPGLLAGPSLEPAKAKPRTIVERDFDGRVKIPDTTPEQAALALLEIDEATRAKVDRVLTRRLAILTEFVGENLFLLQQLDTADKAGDKMGTLLFIYKAAHELRGLTENGTLQHQIAQTLPRDQARAFNAILAEFWKAYADEGVKFPNKEGKPRGRVEVVIEAKAQSLGKEIERTLQSMVSSGDLIARLLLKDITLRPEQRARVADILEIYTKQAKDAPTEKQNQQLFATLLTALDKAQQKQMIANLKALMGESPKPATPDKAKAPAAK